MFRNRLFVKIAFKGSFELFPLPLGG